MKQIILITSLLILLGLPTSTAAQTICQCQIIIVGTQSPPAAGSSQSCPVSTITVNASGGDGAPFTLDTSNIAVGAPPASVTANPQTCIPSTPSAGTSQVTIPFDQCRPSFSGSIDVSVNVNQSPQIFTGTITNCQSRVLNATNSYGTILDNPLETDDPMQLIAMAIRAGLGVIGSLTLIAFVAGGFMWVTSAGNADRVKQGLNTMLYAAIGIAVIFTAYAVLQFVLGSVGAA